MVARINRELPLPAKRRRRGAIAGVYAIICLPTGKRYIGSSIDAPARMNFHKGSLRSGKHRNLKMQRAWAKYGERAFKFKIILVCSVDNLCFYEQLLVDFYRPFPGVLNVKYKVDELRDVWSSPGYRINMSASIKKVWADPDFRKRLKESSFFERRTEALKATLQTPEGRRKRSEQALRQWATPGAKEARSALLTKVFRDPKIRAKRSKFSKRLWTNPKHRKHISKLGKIRNADPEFKEQFKAAIRKGWDNLERRAAASERMRKQRAAQKERLRLGQVPSRHDSELGPD
jgi:group I intron endonuclease